MALFMLASAGVLAGPAIHTLKDIFQVASRKNMKELKNLLGSVEYEKVVSMQYDPKLNEWDDWMKFVELIKDGANFKKLYNQLEIIWREKNREYWDRLPEEVKLGIERVLLPNG